jgi:transposase
MRTGISTKITRPDRRRLEAITKDRNASQKHAWRAAIVLLSADGVGTNEIMRRTGTSKTCVWRWQQRFMEEGVDGLLRDKTRPSRIPRFGPEVAERVVALTLADPPTETTHWTADLMARASDISASAVRRIVSDLLTAPCGDFDKSADVDRSGGIGSHIWSTIYLTLRGHVAE